MPHAALDAGVELIDTADCYAIDDEDRGHNERLIRSVLTERSETRVTVATKGGLTRRGGRWNENGTPRHLPAACERSLRNLAVETVALYYLHCQFMLFSNLLHSSLPNNTEVPRLSFTARYARSDLRGIQDQFYRGHSCVLVSGDVGQSQLRFSEPQTDGAGLGSPAVGTVTQSDAASRLGEAASR